MTKFEIYRQDVYNALTRIKTKKIAVNSIIEKVDWGTNRETTRHNVRESIRDLAAMGLVTSERVGNSVVIRKTDQFGANLIRNPWIGDTKHGDGYQV